MNLEGVDLGSSLTVGGIFSAVLLLFTGIEQIQSPENKAVVADWIKSGNLTEVVGLSENVRQLFSSLFGKNHFSKTCILRSIALSVVIDVIVMLFWLFHYKEYSNFIADLETVKGYWKFLIISDVHVRSSGLSYAFENAVDHCQFAAYIECNRGIPGHCCGCVHYHPNVLFYSMARCRICCLDAVATLG